MWDLNTIHAMEDRAQQEYLRKEKPDSPLAALREILRVVHPPSISLIVSLFQNVETYGDFVKLVRNFLPEREPEILGKTSPSAQMAAFAAYFEDRYLPLHPAFKDGEVEDDYYELLRDIPVMVMGFSWEEYHELNSARLGMQLMCYLIAPPLSGDSDMTGERIALLDGFPPAYQHEAKRVPDDGISLDAARRIFKGRKWVGLRHCAEYINQSTDNWFLDTDEEMKSSMQNEEWDRETVNSMKAEWGKANAYYDKIMKFAAWLEDQKDGAAHFRETIDFLLAESKQGDVNDTGTD
jgi:hypothetical protein